MAGTRLLTDPVLRDRVGHLRRIGALPAVAAATAPDAVLISHAHHDHLDVPSLRRLPKSTRAVVPTGCGSLLRRAGLRNVEEVAEGERVTVGDVEIVATPAEHVVRRNPVGAHTTALGFIVSGERRVYFAGDTDLFEGMRDLADDLDVALLPVWGWGTKLPPGHLDPERAARAAALLRPRIAVPIHWGSIASPRGRLAEPEWPAREFARLAETEAPGVEVRILRAGEELRLG